jgi:hypothetical protein
MNSQTDAEEESFDVKKVAQVELTSGPLLLAEVILLTIVFAYGTKYGH